MAELSDAHAVIIGHGLHGPASMRIELEGDQVRAEAWGPGADDLLARLPGVVGAHDDPSALVPCHEVVRRAARRHPGLRVPAVGVVYDTVIPTVLAQRVSGLEAARGLRALVARFGRPAPGPAGHRMLPEPDVLGGLGYAQLHPCGIERARARTLIAVAGQTARLQRAFDTSHEEGSRRLAAIRGIGPWTVALVRAAVAGDPDVVPRGDYNLPHLVSWALAGERRGDDARMEELLEPYAGQRGRVLRLLHAVGAGPPRRAPRAAVRDFSRH